MKKVKIGERRRRRERERGGGKKLTELVSQALVGRRLALLHDVQAGPQPLGVVLVPLRHGVLPALCIIEALEHRALGAARARRRRGLGRLARCGHRGRQLRLGSDCGGGGGGGGLAEREGRRELAGGGQKQLPPRCRRAQTPRAEHYSFVGVFGRRWELGGEVGKFLVQVPFLGATTAKLKFARGGVTQSRSA